MAKPKQQQQTKKPAPGKAKPAPAKKPPAKAWKPQKQKVPDLPLNTLPHESHAAISRRAFAAAGGGTNENIDTGSLQRIGDSLEGIAGIVAFFAQGFGLPTVPEKLPAVLGAMLAEVQAAKVAELRRIMVVVPVTTAVTETVREWAAVKSRANGLPMPAPQVVADAVGLLIESRLWTIPPASEMDVTKETTDLRGWAVWLDCAKVNWSEYAGKDTQYTDLRAWLQGVGAVPPDDVQELFPAAPESAAVEAPADPEIPPAVEPEPGVNADELRPEADPQPAPVRDAGELS